MKFDRELMDLAGQHALRRGERIHGRPGTLRESFEGVLVLAATRPLLLDRPDRLLLPPAGVHKVFARIGRLPLGVLEPFEKLVELVEPAREFGDQIGPDRWHRLIWLVHRASPAGRQPAIS